MSAFSTTSVADQLAEIATTRRKISEAKGKYYEDYKYQNMVGEMIGILSSLSEEELAKYRRQIIETGSPELYNAFIGDRYLVADLLLAVEDRSNPLVKAILCHLRDEGLITKEVASDFLHACIDMEAGWFMRFALLELLTPEQSKEFLPFFRESFSQEKVLTLNETVARDLAKLFDTVGLKELFLSARRAATTASQKPKPPKSKRGPKAQTTEDATVPSEPAAAAPFEPPAVLDVAAVLAKLAPPAEPPAPTEPPAQTAVEHPVPVDCAPNDSDDE